MEKEKAALGTEKEVLKDFWLFVPLKNAPEAPDHFNPCGASPVPKTDGDTLFEVDDTVGAESCIVTAAPLPGTVSIFDIKSTDTVVPLLTSSVIAGLIVAVV